MKHALCAALAALTVLVIATPAKADGTKCRLSYTLESVAFIYEQGKGEGTIRCENGQSARVTIKTHGGGANFGGQKIKNGQGVFTRVKDIKELYGSYASSNAGAAASKSARAQALTKGSLSLSLSGTGEGFGIALGFGSFKISPYKAKKK